MASLSTFGKWLATLDENELSCVIAASPLVQAGARLRSLDELAERLQHPATVVRVLLDMPAPVLELLEAVSALGEAARLPALIELLSPAGSPGSVEVAGVTGSAEILSMTDIAPMKSAEQHAEPVEYWLNQAQRVALLWRDGDRICVNPGFDQLVNEPLRISRPARLLLGSRNSDELARLLHARHVAAPPRKAERLAAALNTFSHLPRLRTVIADAPQRVLDTLTSHVSRRLASVRGDVQSLLFADPDDPERAEYEYYSTQYDHDAYQRDQECGRWVEAAGLGVAYSGWGYAQNAEMPSEVYLALAPSSFRAPFHPIPPPVTFAPVADAQVQRASTAALTHFVITAMTVYETVARDGLAVLKKGGVGVRELARLTKLIGEEAGTVRLVLELGASLGLFDYVDNYQLGGSEEFERWRRLPPHRRAFDLVATWMRLDFAPTAERDKYGAKLAVFTNDGAQTGEHNGTLLTQTITALISDAGSYVHAGQAGAAGSIGDGESLGVASSAEMVDLLAWIHPMVPAVRTVLAHTWDEALALGVVADGVVTPFAHAINCDDEHAALMLLEELLPANSSEAIFGSDLTVVVAGSPAPEVADLLTLVAEREAHGAANIWRASEASVRNALDIGYDATDLAAALRDIASGPLPQTWDYLFADTARKHGRLRVVAAYAVISCDDEALLAEVVSSRTLQTLGLALVAPTVAVSSVAAMETLRRLREAGFLPIETDPAGTPLAGIQKISLPAATVATAGSAADAPEDEGAVERNPYRWTSSDTDRSLGAPPDLAPGLAPGLAPDLAPGIAPETAAELASRLLSDNPDSNPYPGEVSDAAEVERQIASFTKRLSATEVHELADAEIRMRSVTIRYRSSSGTDTIRMISQLSLVANNLFAFCHLRNAERIFRLDRIVEVVPVLDLT